MKFNSEAYDKCFPRPKVEPIVESAVSNFPKSEIEQPNNEVIIMEGEGDGTSSESDIEQ